MNAQVSFGPYEAGVTYPFEPCVIGKVFWVASFDSTQEITPTGFSIRGRLSCVEYRIERTGKYTFLHKMLLARLP